MDNRENYIEEIASRIRSEFDSAQLPNEGLDQLFASYALLALTKGPEVTNEDVHDAWSVWATEFDEHNPSLVPFDQLSPETQAEDGRFRDAINKVASELA
jgi:hypothetical protein